MDILIYALIGLCLSVAVFCICFIFISILNKSYKKYKKQLQEYKMKFFKEWLKANGEAEDD